MEDVQGQGWPASRPVTKHPHAQCESREDERLAGSSRRRGHFERNSAHEATATQSAPAPPCSRAAVPSEPGAYTYPDFRSFRDAAATSATGRPPTRRSRSCFVGLRHSGEAHTEAHRARAEHPASSSTSRRRRRRRRRHHAATRRVTPAADGGTVATPPRSSRDAEGSPRRGARARGVPHRPARLGEVAVATAVEDYERHRDRYVQYANERLLFHGTCAQSAEDVLKHPHGSTCVSSEAFYGRGVYLADDLNYAIGGRYAHRVSATAGTPRCSRPISAGVQQDGRAHARGERAMAMPGGVRDGRRACSTTACAPACTARSRARAIRPQRVDHSRLRAPPALPAVRHRVRPRRRPRRARVHAGRRVDPSSSAAAAGSSSSAAGSGRRRPAPPAKRPRPGPPPAGGGGGRRRAAQPRTPAARASKP